MKINFIPADGAFRRLPFIVSGFFLVSTVVVQLSCNAVSSNSKTTSAPVSGDSHQKMLALLADTRKKLYNPNNFFCAEARIAYYDSILPHTQDPMQQINFAFLKASALLEKGDEASSIGVYKLLLPAVEKTPDARKMLLSSLAVAYLRLGERANCVAGHTAEACIMPIRGTGIHQDQTGAREAIKIYETLLKEDPQDYDSRWLINIAYMTLGEYPGKVPAKWLIPGLDNPGPNRVNPFVDVAIDLKINTSDRAGGCIVDDFDNDGYLDLVTSAWGLDDPMHYFHNNGDGTFSNWSHQSGLDQEGGGLNLTSTDYNNDGWLDIFVLRGGWQGGAGPFGNQPKSLLRNNGDGTFTDVTLDAGLFSPQPSQTATWNDFNNDGWLDVFIGHESQKDEIHPCQLYLNNGNGTFTEMAKTMGIDIITFAKGVTSGDYDNDGDPDIAVSTMDGVRLLFSNKGGQAGFEDVTAKAGLDKDKGQTFGTFFFDYDNDGWPDLLFCNYDFGQPLSYYAAREALHPSSDMAGKVYVYHNNQDGTFTNTTAKLGLNQVAFAMGNNFGDIDNDGFLDFYLGTGNPNYRSLVPNKLFKNMGGKKFADVTTSARVGNLQKGHGVAFADIDNDGDQDIHVEMGGAYRGDAYPNSLYLNPGQGSNNWICIKLEGTQTNKAAIGTKITLKVRENGQIRQIYRVVNTGGSFGCSPLRREIGIGEATVIDEIVIQWPVGNKTQVLKNVAPNQFIKVKEGQEGFEPVSLKTLAFPQGPTMPMCAPESLTK